MKSQKLPFLSIHDLYSAVERPELRQLSLQLLAQYYEAFLMPYMFCYTVQGKEIILRFHDYCFPHLLGLEDIVKNQLKRQRRASEISNYRSKEGFKRCMNGIHTYDKLRTIDKGKLNSYRYKSQYFYLIPYLVENPKLARYDVQVNNIQLDFLVFEEHHKAIIHLGIVKEFPKIPESKFFVPKTFLIEPISDIKDGMQYLKGQTHLECSKIERTILLDAIAATAEKTD